MTIKANFKAFCYCKPVNTKGILVKETIVALGFPEESLRSKGWMGFDFLVGEGVGPTLRQPQPVESRRYRTATWHNIQYLLFKPRPLLTNDGYIKAVHY